MNEKLNLVEILKDCPKGTKLYSTIHGEVEFERLKDGSDYPVLVKIKNEQFKNFTSTGKWTESFDGECVLFPSKDQRDWSKFKPKKPKFDPKTLQPFDKVIGKYGNYHWTCDLFSHINKLEYPYKCVTGCYKCCIPYNDDTKHLVGTTDEAPEFYRYWED